MDLEIFPHKLKIILLSTNKAFDTVRSLKSVFPLGICSNTYSSFVVGLLCVFFWAVYRPYLFGLGAVFLLGVFADLQSTGPLGLNLFMFLVMYLLVINLSKYIPEKTFELMWLGLSLLLFAVLFSGWFLLSVYYAQFLPIKGLVFSYFISLAVYPDRKSVV